MKYETVLLETANNIATISLNRPDRLNTLTPKMGEELTEVFGAVDADPEVRVVVLAAKGKVFSAGADIDQWFLPMAEERRKGNPGDWTSHTAERTPLALARVRKPVIAAINGAAVGWGCSVTLPCDIRVAAETARLSVAFVKAGVSPEMGASYYLPRLVGLGRACELIMTGRSVDAREALQIGLVNRVVPPEDLMKATYEMASAMVKLPPLALMVSKRLIYRGLDNDLAGHVQHESYAINYLFSTQDFEEACRAFLEKRPPVYRGK